jgi:hypothetical protein
VELLLFASVIFYAYTIGAKDNFKGVATLFGRSVSDYRKAILWFNMRVLRYLSGVISREEPADDLQRARLGGQTKWSRCLFLRHQWHWERRSGSCWPPGLFFQF